MSSSLSASVANALAGIPGQPHLQNMNGHRSGQISYPQVSTPRFSTVTRGARLSHVNRDTLPEPTNFSAGMADTQLISANGESSARPVHFSSGTTDARYPNGRAEGRHVVSSSPSTSITMSILTSGSSSRSVPAYSAVSLFPVQGPPSNAYPPNRVAPSHSQGAHLQPSQHFSEPSLGLGMAFSGLPGSLSIPSARDENDPEQQGQGNNISGPLSKRLRTRHFQEQAKASQGNQGGAEERQPAETPRPVGTGSEILRNSLEGKSRNHSQRPANPPQPPELQSNSQSLASLMAAPPLVENVLINLETGRLEAEAVPAEVPAPVSGAGPSRPPGPSQDPGGVLFLGGAQQTYSVNLEPSSLTLSALKPKRTLQAKSAADTQQPTWNEASDNLQPATSILKSELEAKSQKDSAFPYISPKKRTLEYAQNHSIEIEQTPETEPEPEKNQEEPESIDEDEHVTESMPEEFEEGSSGSSTTELPLTIGNAPVASRAVASLPLDYLALQLVDGEEHGVVVQRTVPLNCRFGPMEGRLVDAAEDLDTTFPLCFISQGHRLDVSSEDESNWMRFIRPARNQEEQNMIVTEVNGDLFFVTNRVVNVGEELRVWYSEQYAAQHGLSKVPVEAPPPDRLTGPKKNVDRHKNTRSFGVNVARENIAEASHDGSGSANFTCDICGRKFERQASLARHLALHRGDKSFSCPDCGQKFSHTFNLERHRKKVHHSDPSGQHVRCSNCGIWFPSSMVLKVHMFSHHPNKEEQNWTVEDAMAQSGKEGSEQGVEEMKFQCPGESCGCQYDTWLELVEHAGDHGTPCLPFDNPDLLATGPIHKCELCYKTFASDERLKKHMAVHAGDETKPLECETCGKRFLTNSALAGHIKTHVNPDTLYDCPICLQEFEQVSSLKEHVYVHKEGGSFTCPHCQKTFAEYPNIRKHIRSFHAEKRFSCNICSKSFTGKDKLKIHMVRHSEAKDFMCDDCGKQFKRKDKLREHVKRMHNLPGARKDRVAVLDNPTDKFNAKVSFKFHVFSSSA